MSAPAEYSIIIPSYNRPDRLRECLQALMALQSDRYEIIVVDDGSASPLEPVCRPFGPTVRCVRQSNSGPGIARNRGVREAKGHFIAFTDDDCRPRPDWLNQLVLAHNNSEDRLVGGYVANGLPQNIYSSTSQEICDFLYAFFEKTGDPLRFFTSNNIACSRRGFLSIGGFDETFAYAGGEDRDFSNRWRESGRALTYAPNAIVDHFHSLNLSSFFRQHKNYGRGARQLHRRMSQRASETHKTAGLKFYFDLVGWPVRQDGLRGLPRSALVILSQVAMIAGYASAGSPRSSASK